VEETPFDVKDWEANVIGRFFSYIMGEEADRDIATIKWNSTVAAPTLKLVRCSRCSAPYTREVYRGQTSVQCEYCGTQIVVQ